MTQLRMTFRFALTALCVAAACASQNRLVTTTSGLGYRVRVEGSGPAAASGDTVSIHEITTLPSGVVIFSSRDKKTPVTFLLGGNQVISGVDEGVRGMRWASADC